MKYTKILWVLLCGSIASASSFGASDGSLGQTSTGSINLTANVPPLAKITKLVDPPLFTIADFSGSSGSRTVKACIYTNTGGYKVTATSLHPGSIFTLTLGGSQVLPYTVQWEQGDGSIISLSPGVLSATQIGDSSKTDCSDISGGPIATGFNAAIIINILSSDYFAKPTGNFTDTLTLTITPV